MNALTRIDLAAYEAATDQRQIAELNDLIAWALHWRDQIQRHPAQPLARNPHIQLAFVKAGAAIADNWTEWADELNHQINGEG